MKSIELSPFAGINNQADPDSELFLSRRTQQGTTPAFVREAMDVDLSVSGEFVSREPAVLETALSEPKGMWKIAGKLAYQDGPDFYWDGTKVASGLIRRVVHTSYWGSYFLTDGATHFEITAEGGVRMWGLPVPTVTLAPTSGNLPVGSYVIKAAFVDATGNEGGTSDAVSVTLTSIKGIQVDVANAARVASVRVYCSPVDQPEPVLVGDYALNDFPVDITANPSEDGMITVSDSLRGPPSNAAGLATFRAFLMLWRDNQVFRSEPAEPHVFYPRNFMTFPSDVTAIEASEAGMWVGTKAGLFWVTGDDPKTWIPKRRLPDAIAIGSCMLEDYELPFLGEKGLIALFISPKNGIIAGLENGSTVVLGNYTLPDVSRASIGLVERGDYRRLVIALNR